MTTYNINNVNGPSNIGPDGRIEINNGTDAAAVLHLAGQLVDRLRLESPALVPQAEIVQGELARAGQGGQSPDRGRIRSALETIGIGVATGSGGLALAQEIGRALGL